MVRLLKSDRRTRNYSSRREQLRLLAMFVPLGLVMLLMFRLRDPQTADRINQFFTPTKTGSSATVKLDGAEGGLTPQAQAPDGTPSRATPAAAPSRNALFAQELLKTIQDNTYFRNGEKDAWLEFLKLVKEHKGSNAESAAVDYVQLVDQPDVYRGKFVTVRGTARQITQEKPAVNDLGIQSYYRIVVQPADGTNLPILVYCLELPAQVAVGDDLSINLEVTGLFFKKLSHEWHNGLVIAPVIVAQSFGVLPEGRANTAKQPLAAGKVAESPKLESGTDSLIDETATTSQAEQKLSPRLAEVLNVAGWSQESLRAFDDGEAVSNEQRDELLKLLRRLRNFDAATFANWSTDGLTLDQLSSDPVQASGKLVKVTGHVRKVTRHKLPDDAAMRLEMPEYFECEIATEAGKPVIVWSSRVPQQWLKMPVLDEPCVADALYIKQLLTSDAGSQLLLLAPSVAWYPDRVEAPYVSLGESLLGQLGIDVGLLDVVRNHRPVLAAEREPFYQMIAGVGGITANQLVQKAQANLQDYSDSWDDELKAGDRSRQLLARDVLRKTEEGRYSVAPLFNDAEHQVGQLFVFDGIARRVTRVAVDPVYVRPALGELGSETVDNYYELDVFTDDSQNRPLIFCMRDLPAGFLIGSELQQPVRVAGFYFKNWRYQTRNIGPRAGDGAATASAEGASLSPLLIGRAPIVLQPQQNGIQGGRFVLGGLFLLALAGIWATAAWFAHEDRRFRKNSSVANVTLPPGQSLNDLNVPTGDVPIITEGASPTAGESSN